ncbi:uncharacterized protein PAE49_007942 [Odontesthes bonariensis]
MSIRQFDQCLSGENEWCAQPELFLGQVPTPNKRHLKAIREENVVIAKIQRCGSKRGELPKFASRPDIYHLALKNQFLATGTNTLPIGDIMDRQNGDRRSIK